MERQVDTLCELFHGRLNPTVARELIEECGGLQEAARFLMLSSSDTVRKRLRKNAEYVQNLQKDAEKFRKTLENDSVDTQFSCEACNKMWWKRVPQSKQVSKCFSCRQKYNPVPPEHQWGWGEFECPMRHTFGGFGIMGRTKSKCYRCNSNSEAEMMFVIPPKRRQEGNNRPRRNRHNCNGINCYHSAGEYNIGINDKPPVCIHPRSRDPEQPVKIHYASTLHVSTGSTFVTVLDQGSLDTDEKEQAHSLYTIDEEVW